MEQISKQARGRAGRVAGYRTSQDSDIVFQVRSALKLTQEEFSREVGCSVSTVAKMEREKRTPGTRALKDNLARLAKRAGVSLETKTEEATP